MNYIRIIPLQSCVIELRQTQNRFYWYRPYDCSRTRFYYSKSDAIRAKDSGNLNFDYQVNLPVHVCSF